MSHNVLGQNAHLLEVCDFVSSRLDDRVRCAEQAGDEDARRFAEGSRRVVEQMRHDLGERPWAHREVGNYLLRIARLDRAHPQFRSWWG